MNIATLVPAAPITKKIIRDAYLTRKRAAECLEQLQVAGDELTKTKVDAWSFDVASRGVDLNSIVALYDAIKKELEGQQRKIEAVNGLVSLLELRIKQLKITNGADVVEVLKEYIVSLQESKTADEKGVEKANEAIDKLWEEVRELTPATGSKKK